MRERERIRIQIEAACDSDVGRERARNEDNCYFDGAVMKQEHVGPPAPLYNVFEPDGVFFAIFDGMGGVEGGEIASYLAGRAFQNACAQIEHLSVISETFFQQAVERMNSAVCVDAHQRGNQMGTTFVGFGFCDDRIVICNVGDSKAFRLRAGVLEQLSIDDLSRRTQPDGQKPGLTQCIGIPEQHLRLEPHVLTGRIESGDMYLLCSDGLTDMVPEAQITEVLQTCSQTEICVQKLVDLARDSGGIDNITVILTHVVEKALTDETK